MAKTAEENRIKIALEDDKKVSGHVREYLNRSTASSFKKDIIEFAAQEVEAYKKRLKEAFIARYGHIGSSGAHETIDAVK